MPVSVLGKILDENKTLDNVSLDDGARIIEAINPALWKLLLTKHIDTPGSHYGFKLVAVALGSAIIESLSVPKTYAHNLSSRVIKTHGRVAIEDLTDAPAGPESP